MACCVGHHSTFKKKRGPESGSVVSKDQLGININKNHFNNNNNNNNNKSSSTTSSSIPSTYCPVFYKQVVESNRKDGYWIETIPEPEGKLGLVGYGLGSQVINYYTNPLDPNSKREWEKTEIQNLKSPVGSDKADLRGTGFQDIIICTDYGNTMVDCDKDGGNIYWLENPGYDKKPKPDEGTQVESDYYHWKTHYIGRSTAMHRLRVGHFTRTDKWQVLALPIVRQPFDLESATPVTLFTEPDDLMKATEWEAETIDDGYFHIIHDARVLDYGPNGRTSLQTAIIASQEGLTWLYYEEREKKWIKERLAEGELNQSHQTNFYGTGGVDVGKIKGKDLSYIATCEPFHGNTVAVYIPEETKDDKNNNNNRKIKYNRYVLDVYGPPDTHGEGPIHYVVCGDFDGDGDDEFLIAVRGPFPYQGVFYYKATDLQNGKFQKWQVSQDSAARIAIGDFDGDGYLDFATMAYNVPGYFLAPDPAVNVYYNRFAQYKPQGEISRIVVDDTVGQPVSVLIPRPSNSLSFLTFPIANIGGVEVALEIIPDNSARTVNSKVRGVKVLSGSIMWTDKDNKKPHIRKAVVDPHSVQTTAVNPDDGRIHTIEGAVIVTFTTINTDDIKYTSIGEIPIDHHARPGTDWQKVDSLPWGRDNPKFKGLEFYNLEGLKIGFIEDTQHLAYIQFWAAGKNVNCGIHNHVTDHFAEVHACLVNGTGGGMEYSPDPNITLDQFTEEMEKEMIKLKVPSFHEHGPLWVISQDNRPVLRQDGSIKYPVHKWQSLDGDAFDTWAAFELQPLYASSPAIPHSHL